MNPRCSLCGNTIKKERDLVLVEVGGTLKGAYHRKCNAERRYQVSGSTWDEPPSGRSGSYFSLVGKR